MNQKPGFQTSGSRLFFFFVLITAVGVGVFSTLAALYKIFVN